MNYVVMVLCLALLYALCALYALNRHYKNEVKIHFQESRKHFAEFKQHLDNFKLHLKDDAALIPIITNLSLSSDNLLKKYIELNIKLDTVMQKINERKSPDQK